MAAGRDDAKAREGDAPPQSTSRDGKDFAMPTHLARFAHLRPWHAESRHLIACSLCLRVRRGSSWVAPEDVIRDLRSYELAEPPRLAAAVCDGCAETISSRRIDDVPLAA